MSSLTSFFIGVFITFLATGAAIVVGLYMQDLNYRDKIYPGIYVDGINLSGKSIQEAKKPYIDLNSKLKNVEFEIRFEGEHIATISGEMISLRSNGESIAEQAYLITRMGDNTRRLIQRVQSLMELKRFSFTSSLEYSTDNFDDTFALLEKQYNIEPKNALFEVKDGKVSVFTREENGLSVNTTKAISEIRKKLSEISAKNIDLIAKEPIEIYVAKEVLKPDVTLAQSNNLGIQEIIGVGTSDYSGSIPERVHNLLLATKKLHGTLVPKGQTFSFNKTLGDISRLTGYKQAYVIVNGRTELGDGGGVCQTSTTIFRAALASGLPITEWHAHAYRVHYYENDGKPGRDATTYSPSVDLQFLNNTSGAILIQTEADTENNLLKYTFWE
ncbi:MAG: VanW family protein [Patescibacteria group bacterium]